MRISLTQTIIFHRLFPRDTFIYSFIKNQIQVTFRTMVRHDWFSIKLCFVSTKKFLQVRVQLTFTSVVNKSVAQTN